MEMNEAPQALVKQRNRIEILVVSMGIAMPAGMMLAHKYWLHAYFTDAALLSWLLITLGLPLGPCILWVFHLKKKLALILGNEFKNTNNLVEELTALQKLNEPTAWTLYKYKSRMMLIGEFFGFAQISLIYATFAYFA